MDPVNVIASMVASPPPPRRNAPNIRPCALPAGISHGFGVARTFFQEDRSVAPGLLASGKQEKRHSGEHGERERKERRWLETRGR